MGEEESREWRAESGKGEGRKEESREWRPESSRESTKSTKEVLLRVFGDLSGDAGAERQEGGCSAER
jgi:hypothetical protein